MAAGIDLIRKVGGDLRGAACVIELTFLGGRDKIDVPFEVLMQYDD
jgi:adenine phosphoribosyltransferase